MVNSKPTFSSALLEENVRIGFSLWDGFAALMMMLFQVTWIIPMYRLIISWESISPQFKLGLVLSMIFILAYGLSRGLQQLAVGDGLMRMAETLLLILSLYGGLQLLLFIPPNPDQTRVDPRTGILVKGTQVPTDILIILSAVAVMWRLGVNFGRNGVRQREAERNFRLGLIMWLLFVFGSSMVNVIISLNILFISLFCGLVGLAFSRIGSVNRLKGGGTIQYSRRWIVEIFTGVGAVVAISATLGAFFGGGAGKTLLGRGFRLLFMGLTQLSEPFFLWIEDLISKLQASFGRYFGGGSVIPDEDGLPEFVLPEEILSENQLEFSPPDLQTILPYLIGLIVLILIVRSIWARQSAKGGEPMFYDDDWERGSLFEGLRGSVADLGENLADNMRSWRDKYLRSMLEKARIRRMYARFLGLCENLEIPRRDSQTPIEFILVAGRELPGRYDDIETLTKAYVQVRYGEIPETDHEVREIQEAWRRIREDGEAQKKGRRKVDQAGDE